MQQDKLNQAHVDAAAVVDVAGVQETLAAEADVHTRDGRTLRAAFLAMIGHGAVCRPLLESGANLHANQHEALGVAARGPVEVVEMPKDWMDGEKEVAPGKPAQGPQHAEGSPRP